MRWLRKAAAWLKSFFFPYQYLTLFCFFTFLVFLPPGVARPPLFTTGGFAPGAAAAPTLITPLPAFKFVILPGLRILSLGGLGRTGVALLRLAGTALLAVGAGVTLLSALISLVVGLVSAFSTGAPI